jgi:SM-20-related protein
VIRLSPDLDVAALAEAFARGGRRLHIPGVLATESAEAVADVLEVETRWRTTVAAGGTYLELPLNGRTAEDPAKQAWLDEAAVDGSNPLTQYIFDTRRLTADRELALARNQAGEGDAADAVLDFLNGAAFIAFARTVTGDPRIDLADAQASRYRPGHVLTAHNDAAPSKNRLYGYVLNFSRGWRADWGGNLVFYGEDGHIQHGWVPAFNALNLFEVPTRHAVTQVASFAARDRLSIVGWLRSNTRVAPQAQREARTY